MQKFDKYDNYNNNSSYNSYGSKPVEAASFKPFAKNFYKVGTIIKKINLYYRNTKMSPTEVKQISRNTEKKRALQ
jgi:hypothetical protein